MKHYITKLYLFRILQLRFTRNQQVVFYLLLYSSFSVLCRSQSISFPLCFFYIKKNLTRNEIIHDVDVLTFQDSKYFFFIFNISRKLENYSRIFWKYSNFIVFSETVWTDVSVLTRVTLRRDFFYFGQFYKKFSSQIFIFVFVSTPFVDTRVE